MRTHIQLRTASLALVAAMLLTTAAAPALAKAKREPLEKFRARAFNVDWGGATNLDIVIYEWTTPEERQGLFKTFFEQGGDALYDALDDVSEKGYLKMPRTLGYDMQYAWQTEAEGRRRIVLATDRPMGFMELSRASRTTDYNVSLVILDLDPATSEGEGTVILGAELSVDKETGQMTIEIAGHQPTKLAKVRPLKK
jgi:hypothetical protein